ncbi:hypothetical protein Y032_0029g1937 [Ancylostoma ceylanicum]|uniref:Uncharacterized protein n=1 Tax=Ancylostoma ceylanicum TaxID=53326 RepID=A0A016USH8_9BILA|nr:hypothetical protein Y032_0029g1937 [Ancylostoma ceylanicum]
MRLGSSTLATEYKMSMHSIDTVRDIRDLGFFYNNKLDFAIHYKELFKRACNRTYQIFKALAMKDSKVLLKAYKIYVRPLVESGTVVFFPHRRRDIAKLERIQNNFTRKIFFRTAGPHYSRIPSAKNRDKRFKLSSLESRREIFDVCMVHKLLDGMSGANVSLFFTLVQSLTRAGETKISYSRPKTAVRANFFTVRAGSTYIRLKKTTTLTRSLASFKRKMTKLILRY